MKNSQEVRQQRKLLSGFYIPKYDKKKEITGLYYL